MLRRLNLTLLSLETDEGDKLPLPFPRPALVAVATAVWSSVILTGAIRLRFRVADLLELSSKPFHP